LQRRVLALIGHEADERLTQQARLVVVTGACHEPELVRTRAIGFADEPRVLRAQLGGNISESRRPATRAMVADATERSGSFANFGTTARASA